MDTEIKDGSLDLLSLSWGPVVVHPVVSDSEGGSELGYIEEMLRVPVVARVSKRIGSVSSSILVKTCGQDESKIPEQ